jgi:hypothetical protein
MQSIERTIESMLTRLAELDALVNTVRHRHLHLCCWHLLLSHLEGQTSPEINATADAVLPLLAVKTKQLEAIFYMIEKLEVLALSLLRFALALCGSKLTRAFVCVPPHATSRRANAQTFVQAVNNSVVQMEESVDESERLFSEVNPTSITKALGFFKWVC